MQVVPENLNITNGYQVFETPDALYINNQAYDKFTMEPKPFDFFNTNYHINHKNMLKYQVNILEYNYVVPFKEPNCQYMVQDNHDANIFYCLTEVGATDSNQYICKFKKENDKWKLLNNIQPNGSYNFPNGQGIHVYQYKILGQTDDYLILYQEKMGATAYDASGASAVGNYNAVIYHSFNYIAVLKNNFTSKTLNVTNDALDLGIFTIKETNNVIYVYENINGRNLRFIKYNPSTNIRTVIATFDARTYTIIYTLDNNDFVGISNIIKHQNYYYTLIGQNGDQNYRFLKFDINFDTDTVSVIENVKLEQNMPLHSGRANSLNPQWMKYSLTSINDQYIHITAHYNANAIMYHVYVPSHTRYYENKGYIVTLDNDVFLNNGWLMSILYNENNFVTKINELNGLKIQGILYYNQYIPIFLTSVGVLGFKFNQETETFEQIINKSGTYYTIGLDENNMLYLFDSNDNCEIYSVNTVDELKAEFEHDEYNYDNQNVSSYISIYAKNFLKDYIKTKVKLTLTGQCYFTQNNQKELITYTDKNGIKNIPITITYGGVLNCDIQELE